MKKRRVILLVLTTILIGGGLAVMPSCNTQGYSADGPSVDPQALLYYAQGKYRHSLDVLKKKKRLNVLELYLMARDYQELQDPEAAVTVFRKIKDEKLAEFPQGTFFQENYRYYFSKALIDSPEPYPFSLQLVSNFMTKMSASSPYYQKTRSIYYYYMWKNTNNIFFLKHKNPNEEILRYQRIIRFAQGEKSLLSQILLDYREADYHYPYKVLFKVVKVSHLKNKTDLGRAVDIAVAFRQYELAGEIVKKHYKLVKDYDYYIRNMAIITFRSVSRKKGLEQLLTLEKQGKASSKTVRLLLRYLKNTKGYTTGRQVAYRATVKYGESFYEDYIYFLKRTDYYTTLYKWYLSKVKEKGFRSRYGNEVIRIMLRHKPEYAAKLTREYLDHRLNYPVLLISALLYYESGTYQKAYPEFLRIVLEYPYSYEWLVARHYEEKLRSQYSSLYKQKFETNIKKIEKYSLKNQVYYASAYRQIDPSLFQKWIGDKKLQDLSEKYEKAIYQSFSVKGSIPGLEKYSQAPFNQWNQESLNYINHEINKKSEFKKYIRFRYTYKYKELFESVYSRGDVVSRLHTLSMKLVLSRRFHKILPLQIQKDLYPLEAFEFIESHVKNTNTSLWVLSSFREESHFRKKARSWVGAQGYAQVMPYTARLLKKNMKRPELSNYDFEDNVLMGVTLFKHLFRRYKNNFAYALGAYNGGEGAVNRWRKRYKDYDTELWIDCVEFDETRDYIKKIMLTRYFYEELYDFPRFEMADFKRSFK